MKINSIILSELNKSEQEYLNELFTRTVSEILTSELSQQEINELIEVLQLPSHCNSNN